MMRPDVEEEGLWAISEIEVKRAGSVALSVLNEPRTSMSMTDFMALGERSVIGARKLPAAPALLRSQVSKTSDPTAKDKPKLRHHTSHSRSLPAQPRIVQLRHVEFQFSSRRRFRSPTLWLPCGLLRCLLLHFLFSQRSCPRCRRLRRDGQVLGLEHCRSCLHHRYRRPLDLL